MNTSYTKEQISQLEAGRELDALIAEHVMGYRKVANPWGGEGFFYESPAYQAMEKAGANMSHARGGVCVALEVDGGREAVLAGRVPKGGWPTEILDFYSTDITAAFQVVEQMRGKQDDVRFWITSKKTGGWEVGVEPRSSLATATVEEPTLPLAICKAALLLLC